MGKRDSELVYLAQDDLRNNEKWKELLEDPSPEFKPDREQKQSNPDVKAEREWIYKLGQIPQPHPVRIRSGCDIHHSVKSERREKPELRNAKR